MRKSTPRESSRFLNEPIVERVSEAPPLLTPQIVNCPLIAVGISTDPSTAEIVFENCLVGPVL